MTAASVLDIGSYINRRKMTGYQWLLLLLCFAIVATDGMNIAIMGFLAPDITREWSISRAAFGFVMSAAPVGLAIGSLLVGPLSDRFGRKRLLIAAIGLSGTFNAASAFASGVPSLSALRFLAGLGLGAAMPNAATLLSEYVPARTRNTLVALMFSGFNLGAALAGFVAGALLQDNGWRMVLILGGAVPLACLPLYLWLLPESVRFLVIKKFPAERIARMLRRVCGQGDFSDSTTFTVNEPSVHEASAAKVLLSPAYRAISVALWSTCFMGLLVIYLLSGWLPTLIKDAGVPIERAANLTALFQLGGTAGALVTGLCMDRWRANKVIATAYLLGAAFILLLAYESVASRLFGAYVLFAGFCMSGAQSGMNAYASTCYPTRVRATGVSWMLGIGRFGSIFGFFAGGVLLTIGWTFGSVVAALAVPAAVAALSIAFLGPRPAAAKD